MAAVTTGIAPSNGIEIAYETHGDPDDEPLLLVMGLGAQLIAWPIELVDALVDRGFYVDPLRQPRRRAVHEARRRRRTLDFMAPVPGRPRRARPIEAPYLLTDMAADGIGAARPPRHRLGPHRRRVDGRDDRADDGDRAPRPGAHAHVDHVHHRRRRRRPAHARGACRRCSARRPPTATRRSPAPSRRAGSSAAPMHFDEAHARKRAEEAYDRCFYPAGVARQLLGILASGSRAEGLAQLDVPTLVIHGAVDPLVTSSGGERTAELDPRRRAPRPRGHGPRPAAAALCRRSSTPSPRSSPAPTPDRRLTTEGPRCLDPSPA